MAAIDPDGADAKASGPFVLSNHEAHLWGVRLTGTELMIGPTGGAWLARLGVAALASAVGLGIVASNTGPVLRVFAALYVAGFWLDAWRRLRHRLICTPDGMEVRHGTFRRLKLKWVDITDVRVGWNHYSDGDSADGSRPTWEFSGPIWRAPKHDWPVVATPRGGIDVFGLATFNAGDGFSRSDRSGADERVLLVRRYAQRHGVASVTTRRVVRPWPGISFWAVHLTVVVGFLAAGLLSI